MSMVYGIDLGTTFCACARVDAPSMDSETLPIDQGGRHSLASAVYLVPGANGPRAYVGRRAMQMSIDQPEGGTLVEFAKRYIGLPSIESKFWHIGDQELDPVDISALLLRKIRDQVGEYDRERPLHHVVVTHPRDFTLPRKEATANAAALAGLDLIDTLNEPEAAAYTYFEPGGERAPGLYVVFDLGGGTLDIALLDVPERGRVQVLGGCGVSQLGGKDWDERMLEEIYARAEAHHARDGIDYRAEISRRSAAELRSLSREFKERSAGRREHKKLFTTRLIDGNEVPTLLAIQVEDWERRCEPLLDGCEDALEKALAAAGKAADQVTRVLPVGGSVRLKSVQALLARRFPGRVEPVDIPGGVNVDLAVALGAARFASYTEAQTLARTTTSGAVRSMLAPIIESGLASTLAHGINVLVDKDGDDHLECLVATGSPMPATAERVFAVVALDDHLHVEIFEGPAGPRPAGAPPSSVIEFPRRIGAQVGDRIRVFVDLTSSGRATVRARHERSGDAISVVLKPGDADAAPADTATSDQRRARLERIEVV